MDLHEITSNDLDELNLPYCTEDGRIALTFIRDLLSQVQASQQYTRAQTSLLSCVNAANQDIDGSARAVVYQSTDILLDDYTGTFKDRVDQCDQEANFFTTMQQVMESAITTMRSDPGYSQWLDTDTAYRITRDMGRPELTKHYLEELAGLRPSVQTSSRNTPRQVDHAPDKGLDCIPTGSDRPTPIQGRLRVLNCLVFGTPHSFWHNIPNELQSTIMEEERAYPLTSAGAKRAYLGSGDWECTNWIDWYLPACLKHDVSWSSLEIIAGPADSDHPTTLDRVWNPRNKHLADSTFFKDIVKYGCSQNPDCPRVTNILMAFVMYWAVSIYNDRDWPVTQADFNSHQRFPRFIDCGEDLRVTNTNLEHHDAGTGSAWDDEFTMTWTAQSGCALPEDMDFMFKWEVQYRDHEGLQTNEENYNDRRMTRNGNSFSMRQSLPSDNTFDDFVSLTWKRITIKPANVLYGDGITQAVGLRFPAS